MSFTAFNTIHIQVAYSNYGDQCTTTSQCNPLLFLTCLNNQCLCDSKQNLFWKAATSSCVQTTICEGQNSTLFCSVGVIYVHSAIYGRDTLNKCNSSRIHMLGCHTDQAYLWKSRCSGRTSCSVFTTNHYYDPCPDTYKYLDVIYDCVPQDNTLLGMSTINFSSTFKNKFLLNIFWNKN